MCLWVGRFASLFALLPARDSAALAVKSQTWKHRICGIFWEDVVLKCPVVSVRERCEGQEEHLAGTGVCFLAGRAQLTWSKVVLQPLGSWW